MPPLSVSPITFQIPGAAAAKPSPADARVTLREVNWDEVDTAPLCEVIREQAPPADAERMIWALEHILAAARVDACLLDHLAVAAVCSLSYRDGQTPRHVLEFLFRRAIDDERWRQDYASLLSPAG